MSRPKTIREALENLSAPEYCAWESLAECFPQASNWMGPLSYGTFAERFKRHWVASWICTDTQVGISIITLDGKPVAVSQQTARKSNEDIRFLSPEAVAEVFRVMDELANKWEDRHSFVDLDEEIDPRWYERSETIR